MLQSVGNQLKQARLARSLSIEQVAHATKIRPERVVDLENDELSNFPDLSYAKGFLILYAKYLGVDVSDFTSTLNGSKRMGVGDYEYLQNAHPRPGTTVRLQPKQSPVAFLVMAFAAVLILLGIFVVPRLFQIGNFDEAEKRRLATEREAAAAMESATPSPTASATPVPVSTPVPTPTPTPGPSATPEPTVTVIPVETPTPISVAPVTTPEPSVEIRRAEPVRPAAPAR